MTPEAALRWANALLREVENELDPETDLAARISTWLDTPITESEETP